MTDQVVAFRAKEFEFLQKLLSLPIPTRIPIVWLQGGPSSGKSTLITQIITAHSSKKHHSNPIFLWDCHFWTDEREFFQDLSSFLTSEMSISWNRNTFINLLNEERTNAFWLILDHVDELPPSTDLVEFLVKASELANGKISFLFASRKPSYSIIDNLDAFPIVLPEHGKNAILEIVKGQLFSFFPPTSNSSSVISLIVDYFYPFYPQVRELTAISKRILSQFPTEELAKPISKIYQALKPEFKNVFDSFYAVTGKSDAKRAFSRFSLLGRHILLCAFLASHNSLKRDINLFAGKTNRSSAKRPGRKAKSSETMLFRSIQNAKAFEIRRLIAIFRNLFQGDHRIVPCDLEIQQEIANYCKLNLLSPVGGAIGGLTKMKIKCNLTFSDAESLIPSFDLKRYLFG